jgi:hypothetical protein
MVRVSVKFVLTFDDVHGAGDEVDPLSQKTVSCTVIASV